MTGVKRIILALVLKSDCRGGTVRSEEIRYEATGIIRVGEDGNWSRAVAAGSKKRPVVDVGLSQTWQGSLQTGCGGLEVIPQVPFTEMEKTAERLDWKERWREEENVGSQLEHAQFETSIRHPGASTVGAVSYTDLEFSQEVQLRGTTEFKVTKPPFQPLPTKNLLTNGEIQHPGKLHLHINT